MIPRLPPPTWLRAFEAAARLGGFTAAAQELGVTPSAISQQIRLLEARLGAPLFSRAGRGVTLTPIGQAYLPAISGAFARMEERTHELFAAGPRRTLRVRVDSSFAMLWLSRRLHRFHTHAPMVDLHISVITWHDPDHLGGEDCAIWFGATDRLPAGAEALTRETFIPVAAPSVATEIRGIEDVIGRPLIHVLADPVGWRDWFVGARLDPSLSVQGPRFDASAGVLEMSAHGGGLALAKATLAGDYIADGRLVRLPGPALTPSEGFCLFGRRREDGDIRSLSDWLRLELGRADGETGGQPAPPRS